VLQGSSLAGRRFERSVDYKHTGEPFDVGRISDYDVAIASDRLHARAQELGIELGQGALTRAQIRALGLESLYNAAQAAALRQTGIAHPVHFKVYPKGGVASTGLDLPLP
jgi:filamentous hemagglutinin